MEKELVAQLLPILDKTKEGIIKGIEILQKEAPLVIREIYTWEITQALIHTSILIVILLGVIIGRHFINKHYNFEEEFNRKAFKFMLAIFTVPLICGILGTLKPILHIMVAPKLWLIKYITNLLH